MYISQCIIVKNEEANIEYCLSHLKSVVDEQIVVDTGSTDRTVEIAEKLGAKVFSFDWIDDFSAAKNYALSKAKGGWVIFLDCDEYFTEESVPLLKKYMKRYMDNRNVDALNFELINIDSNKKVLSLVKNISPRIFKNKKSIRYKNRVHEHLINEKRPDLDFMVAIKEIDDVKIMHTGYDVKTFKDKNKNERNINLIKKMLVDNPEDAKMNYYLSKQFYMDRQYEQALDYGYKTLKYMDSTGDEDYNFIVYITIMCAMIDSDKSIDEIKEIFDEAVRKYPEYPDYYNVLGKAYYKYGNFGLAIECFEKCINYCQNYSGEFESTALGQIENVYYNLLSASIIDNNKQKIVTTAITLLKADKYNYENLTVLIKTLLTSDKEEDIVKFLSKLYDYNNFKDKLYLLKASEASENNILIDFYKNMMSVEELKALGGN